MRLLRQGGLRDLSRRPSPKLRRRSDSGEGTLDSIRRWRHLARECSDHASRRVCCGPSQAAHDSNCPAIRPGFQNANRLEDSIRYVEILSHLGVRVMQLACNNQNQLGGTDSGLARIGQEVGCEMNRASILVDFSHVGKKADARRDQSMCARRVKRIFDSGALSARRVESSASGAKTNAPFSAWAAPRGDVYKL
jgi:microsomal dipeptidase-like Zn-dependent dipeptidase